VAFKRLCSENSCWLQITLTAKLWTEQPYNQIAIKLCGDKEGQQNKPLIIIKSKPVLALSVSFLL